MNVANYDNLIGCSTSPPKWFMLMTKEKKFNRVVLKLSGEALAGKKGYGIDPVVVDDIAGQIQEVLESGLDVAVVNGGGNIWRGLSGSSKGMDRATADYMGMVWQ